MPLKTKLVSKALAMRARVFSLFGSAIMLLCLHSKDRDSTPSQQHGLQNMQKSSKCNQHQEFFLY